MELVQYLPLIAIVLATVAVIAGPVIAITIFARQSLEAIRKTEQATREMQQKVDELRKDMKEHLNTANDIINELRTGGIVKNLPSADFLIALMEQWDFFAKWVTNRVQKSAISANIARELIKSGDTILIDSGSTIDEIPKYLIGKDVTIYTNNIFAVVRVSGISGIRIYQLPGWLDYHFAATYSAQANSMLDDLSIKTVIIATRSISFEEGIHVEKNDEKNRQFKKLLIKYPTAERFIIAADSTKFGPCYENEMPILQPSEWVKLREEKKHKITIITHHPLENVSGDEKIRFNNEIEKFEKYGIEVLYAGGTTR